MLQRNFRDRWETIEKENEMCKKCASNSLLRNTRYCDDWWDDTYHGGYSEDDKFKIQWEQKILEDKNIPSIAE